MLRAIVSGSRGAARFAARARLYTNHGAESGSGMRATTILCVRHEGEVAVVGDGQVSMGSQVMKPNAVKVRRIGTDDEPILTGFAGATADCFTLRERLERKIEEHPGQLTRACVELAKNWRMDKYLRRLDAVLLVANKVRPPLCPVAFACPDENVEGVPALYGELIVVSVNLFALGRVPNSDRQWRRHRATRRHYRHRFWW